MVSVEMQKKVAQVFWEKTQKGSHGPSMIFVVLLDLYSGSLY